MRILILTPRIPYPLNDGGAIAIYNTIKYLAQTENCEVQVCALNTSKHYQDPAVIQDIAKVYTSDIDTDIKPLVALYAYFCLPIPYNIMRFYSHAHEALLIKILKENTFDFIQLEGLYLAQYLPILRKFSKAKIVLRAHNVEYEIWERMAANEGNFFKKLYYKHLASGGKKFEQQNIKSFDGIITITKRDEEVYSQWGYAGKRTTITGGVSPKWFENNPIAKIDNAIVFLGSLEWLPNIQGLEWFINNVWGKVSQQFPNLELHIAGRNPGEEVQKWAGSKIKIFGNVPDAKDFLEQYAISIVPLLSGGGMRIKLIEQMALGMAIVTTAVGAEGIEIEDGKHLLIANDADTYVNKLTKLLEDSNLRKQLATNGNLLVRLKYDYQQLSNSFIEFYNTLLV